MEQGTIEQDTTLEFKEVIVVILLVLDFITGNLDIPFEQFISLSSDPLYNSVLTAGLIKSILKKIENLGDFRIVFIQVLTILHF